MGILRADRITGLGGANAITGSVFFSGQGELRGPKDDDLQFASGGDFTIEAWVNAFHFDDNSTIAATWDQTSASSGDQWLLAINSSGVLRFAWSPERVDDYFITGGTITKDKWHHVALTKSGNTFRIFLDGTQTATGTNSSTNSANSFLKIGKYAEVATSYWYGYISNLRIIKGEALYTSAFTVPAQRLVKTSNTVLLACQSVGDVTKEETGKTLVVTETGSSNSPGPQASRFTPNSPVGFSTTTDVGSQYGTTFDGFGSFATSTYMVPPGGNTRERNRGRGVFAGGYAPSPASLRNIIDYVEIQSTGNAIDFGDLLSINNGEGGACSSSTRALFGGGQSNIVDITFITIANTSNVTDFGDLITGRRSLSAVSSDTKGLFAGGTTPAMKNEIESVTIATAGNASDFGDLTVARRNMAPNSSSTRGVFAGGNPGSSPLLDDTIDFVTIASAGNATDFGNLITAMREQGGSSSATRGLIAGGFTSPANLNTIEFITIATTGNASDFGDLHTAVSGLSGTSNGTRGIFAGGAYINNIQYVTIASTGNAEDFGDLTAARFLYDGTSDSHGGLS